MDERELERYPGIPETEVEARDYLAEQNVDRSWDVRDPREVIMRLVDRGAISLTQSSEHLIDQ